MKKSVTAVILCIIGAISICACSQKTEEFKVIDIGNAYEKREPVMASDYFSAIDYIPLETSEESLLNGTNALTILPAEDRFIILNRMERKADATIESFDLSGNLLEFKAQYGRSEEEFTNVRNIILKDDELFVFQATRISIYDLEGNYKESIHFQEGINPIQPPFMIDTRTFGILGNDIENKKFCIDLIDTTGKRIYGKPFASYSEEAGKERFIERNGMKIPLPTFPAAHFYTNNEKVFFAQKLNDTLYTIDTKDLQKRASYIFDYGKYIDHKSPRRNLFIMETKHFLQCRVLFKKDLFNTEPGYISPTFIYDEASGKTRMITHNKEFDRSGFVNDVNDDALIFMPEVCRGDKMYQLFDAVDFIEFAERSNSAKIKEVAAGITEESNPVLVIGTLK